MLGAWFGHLSPWRRRLAVMACAFALAALLPLTPWTVALAVTVLTLVVESLVVRHYGIAAIFITPLALLPAEGANWARPCRQGPCFRAATGRLLRRLLPGLDRGWRA
jgi:hypothetical protein